MRATNHRKGRRCRVSSFVGIFTELGVGTDRLDLGQGFSVGVIELHLAAAPADRKDPVLEKFLAKLDVAGAVPDRFEALLAQIAHLDPDERAEVHFPVVSDAATEKRVEALTLQRPVRRVVVLEMFYRLAGAPVDRDPFGSRIVDGLLERGRDRFGRAA